MSYLSHVGSFNIDPAVTAGNTQSIADVGFQPKIVLFWWSGSTATGDEVAGGTINIGFGAAIDNTHRFCIDEISEDAQTDSDSLRALYTTEIIRAYTDTATLDGIMDFSLMDANGFTVIVDDQFTQAYRINYMALGGDDLTNVYIGNIQTPVNTGNYSIAGVGFKPDAILLFTRAGSSLNSSSSNLYFGLGMATGTSNQGTVSVYSSDNQVTTSTAGYGYNGEAISYIVGSLGYGRSSFVSFDNDGFTLNALETNSYQYYILYIALKGGQYSVGDILTRTDGNDISETVGFQPVSLLFASANRALSTQDTATNDARISIGAATSTTNRATQAISDENNLADSETAHANYDSAVYSHVIDDDTTGIMDLKSIESDGFTCVMDENDASACWVTYLAIGESPASSSSSSSTTSSSTSSSSTTSSSTTSSSSESSSSSTTTSSTSSYSAIPGEPTTITTTATATVVDWCEPP
jgi:hypothetical protein